MAETRQYFYVTKYKFPEYFRLLGNNRKRKAFRARIAHMPKEDDLIIEGQDRWLVTECQRVERGTYEGVCVKLGDKK